ncbi:MAG: PIG-L family deacetylase [Ktedonobacteraceae bacterium]
MNNSSSQQDQLRILGVFAHPDDESFCAGGTFARYTNAGAEAMVVSATRGQAGQIRSAKVATRRTLGQVREQELRLACQRLGVQHVVCLDHGDGMLKEVDQEVLIGQVVEIIRSFRPDIVITFGPDGGYGHPDHIAIGTATTAACMRSGDNTQFPEQIAAGLAPHRPVRLYHSHFPAKRQLLLERLVQWLVTTEKRFHGTLDFVHALLLLSEESTLLRYSSDYCDVSWYPSGFFIIEQGEPACNLYLILSGTVEVMRDDPNGTQHVVAQMGPGSFFGEEGLAYRKPRNAHVIAVDNVTCLVFSPNTPTAFLGRGEGAHITNLSGLNEQDVVHMTGATSFAARYRT